MDSQSVNQPLTPASNEDAIEINLLEIFYLFWDHLWQILLCAFLGAAIFFAYDYLNFSPQYTATAKVYVTPVSSDPLYNESTLPSGGNLISDSRELLLTRPILEETIDALDLEMDYQQLSGMVAITIPSGSRLLSISVTGADPVLVADIANQLALLAETEIPPITNTQAPQIVESALVPETQSKPTPLQEGIKGGVLFAFLWCAVLLVRYLWKEYGYLLKRPEKSSKS